MYVRKLFIIFVVQFKNDKTMATKDLNKQRINKLNAKLKKTKQQINSEIIKEVEESKESIIKEIESNPYIVYWDRNDVLSPSQIDLLIKGKFDKLQEQLYSTLDDTINECIETDIIADAVKQVLFGYDDDLLDEFLTEYSEKLDEMFAEYVVIDLDIKTLLRNTGVVDVRVQMKSNFDVLDANRTIHINGGYSYSGIFKQIVDMLNLNPSILQSVMSDKECKSQGTFPNMPERDKKENVHYLNFCDELMCNIGGSCKWVFLAKLDLVELYDNGFRFPNSVTIPEFNYGGLFDSYCGSGSEIDCRATNDITIKLNEEVKDENGTYSMELLYDNASKHSIKSVYDFTNFVWGNPLVLNF